MSLLARLSLANRSLVGLITFALITAGILVVPTLQQQLLPPVRQLSAVVTAQYPGASASTVDIEVTGPLEATLRGTDGVTSISSQSSEGAAFLRLLFRTGTDMEQTARDMQETINRVQAQLPDNVRPLVTAEGTADIPALVLAAVPTRDQTRTIQQLVTFAVPALRKTEGVRDVQLSGVPRQLVIVTVDSARLAGTGVNLSTIAEALRSATTSASSGSLDTSGGSVAVEVGTRFESAEDLASIYVTSSPTVARPPAPIQLRNVARVESVPAPPDSISRVNGKPSVGLSITLATGANAVEVSQAVRDTLPDLSRQVGAELYVVFDQGPPIEDAISGLTKEGLLGLGFAVLVILLFLWSARSTLVTAVSIPLSMVIALLVMRVAGLSLNLFTLAALTIAVGRVVDDSIVVLENISRHIKLGASKSHAITAGVREVSSAITASTLTTVAVFLPIAFVGGEPGQLLSAFAIAVTVALMASLLVSLTIVPVFAHWFLKPYQRKRGEQSGPLQRSYVRVIRFVTTRRVLTMVAALAVLGGTLGLLTRLETNFLDSPSGDRLDVTQRLPADATLRLRDEAAAKLDAILAETPGVAIRQVTVASAPLPGQAAALTSFRVLAAPGTDINDLQRRLRDRTDGQRDLGTIAIAAQGGGGGSGTIDVAVKGSDPQTVRTAVAALRERMAGMPRLGEITDDLTENVPRVRIDIDERTAASVGATIPAIQLVTAAAVAGNPLSPVNIGGTRQDVVLRSSAAPTDAAALRTLPVTTATGIVPLERVATIRSVDEPARITRIDGEPSAIISAKPIGTDIGGLNAELDSVLVGVRLPDGASFAISGASTTQQDALIELAIALLAAVVIVFSILVATFRSLIQPLILLVSIPFAATGAFGLLLATSTPLGLPAMIGLMMLVGIVVTNAIVLIDLINHNRAKGMDIQQAVVEAGRRRLRPILMTAAATIFALVPMALGLTGEGTFVGQPLALVVIGGLTTSTMLTLVVLPALYTMVENVKQRSRRGRKPNWPTEDTDPWAPVPSRSPRQRTP
ncbi:efflux RND transporter permease subunit [Kibdelosporangium aridum]|uniref:efflux RND transporter permease subunit n=1 Tax=Kibdelosporangium aridum TaxID=2030 RepID=UPI0035ECF0CA